MEPAPYWSVSTIYDWLVPQTSDQHVLTIETAITGMHGPNPNPAFEYYYERADWDGVWYQDWVLAMLPYPECAGGECDDCSSSSSSWDDA